MKHLLLCIAFTFVSLGFFIESSAQCTVSNVVIQNVSVLNSTPASCFGKADLTFNINLNNGNKFIFLHVLLQNDYTYSN